MFRVPGLDAGALDGDDAVGGEGLANQHPFSLQQLHQQQAPVGVVEGGADFQGGQGWRGDKQVLDIAFFPHIQPDLPVQAAIGQVVNDVTEGRDFRIFGGVQPDAQQVLPA